MTTRRSNNESTLLAALTEAERALVLDRLVAADSCVRTAAQDAAISVLATADREDVADAVTEAICCLEQYELAAHAGPHRHGYVEPTEAAWLLLERTIEPWIDDIARRARAGLMDAAATVAAGVLDGLVRAGSRTDNSDLLVSWAPDFPDETADRVHGLLVEVGLVELEDDAQHD